MSRCGLEHTHSTRSDRCPACGDTPQAASMLARDLQRAQQSEDLPANNRDAEKGADASVASEYTSAIPAQRTSNPAEAGRSGDLPNAIARVLRQHDLVERGSGCGEYVYVVRDIMALIPEQALPSVSDALVERFCLNYDEMVTKHMKDADILCADCVKRSLGAALNG